MASSNVPPCCRAAVGGGTPLSVAALQGVVGSGFLTYAATLHGGSGQRHPSIRRHTAGGQGAIRQQRTADGAAGNSTLQYTATLQGCQHMPRSCVPPADICGTFLPASADACRTPVPPSTPAPAHHTQTHTPKSGRPQVQTKRHRVFCAARCAGPPPCVFACVHHNSACHLPPPAMAGHLPTSRSLGSIRLRQSDPPPFPVRGRHTVRHAQNEGAANTKGASNQRNASIFQCSGKKNVITDNQEVVVVARVALPGKGKGRPPAHLWPPSRPPWKPAGIHYRLYPSLFWQSPRGGAAGTFLQFSGRPGRGGAVWLIVRFPSSMQVHPVDETRSFTQQTGANIARISHHNGVARGHNAPLYWTVGTGVAADVIMGCTDLSEFRRQAWGAGGAAAGGGSLCRSLPPTLAPQPHSILCHIFIGRDALEGADPPPPLQGAQPMPSHCPPDAKCRLQWHV